MNDTLKTKTARALSWSLAQEICQRGLQLAISIVLARLLAPEEFGLLAMLSVFIAVSQALLDSGFGSAIVQRKDITQVELSSVFYLNLLLGIFLSAALCLAAPGIAAFYDQPQLTTLTRVISLLLVINSFAVVQSALVVRDLDFKRQTLISTASTGISGILGIVLALRGYGAWSLVGQQLSAGVLRTVLYWITSKWHPILVFKIKQLRGLFTYGSRLAASSLLNQVFDNLYVLVIGKLFSTASLGYYTRAQSLQAIPSQSLGTITARVMFPLFSRLQDEPGRLRTGLQKAITSTVFLQLPLMLGLAVVAKPLILVLLTEKWSPIVPYFQLLCLGGLWYPLQLLNLNAIMAIGRSDLFLRLEMIKKSTIILAILLTFKWGVTALVIGQVITSVLAYFINSYYVGQLVGYSTFQQLRDSSPYFLAAGIMSGIVELARFPNQTAIIQLSLKVLIGVVTYSALTVIFRFQAANVITELIIHRFHRPKFAN
jgi:O-antigen/teichoic acid export membrane protein